MGRNFDYSTLKPGVAAFSTEVAVALLGDQEEEIYKARDALITLTGKKDFLHFAENPKDRRYLLSRTPEDVTVLRKVHGQSYLLPFNLLTTPHPGIPYLSEHERLIRGDRDAALARFMMDLNLERRSHEAF
ncbi:hypothetical protein DPSP01_011918 [Paraphaeosphaeria sporulosa]